MVQRVFRDCLQMLGTHCHVEVDGFFETCVPSLLPRNSGGFYMLCINDANEETPFLLYLCMRLQTCLVSHVCLCSRCPVYCCWHGVLCAASMSHMQRATMMSTKKHQYASQKRNTQGYRLSPIQHLPLLCHCCPTFLRAQCACVILDVHKE